MKPSHIFIVTLVVLSFITAGYLVWQNPAGEDRTRSGQSASTVTPAPSVQNSTTSELTSTSEIVPELYEVDIAEGYSLGGISLGLAADKVTNLLGQPVKKERKSMPEIYSDEYTKYIDIWTYDGIEVGFSESVKNGDLPPAGPGTVEWITVTSGNYQTKDGVEVGETFDNLKSRHPEQNSSLVTRILMFRIVDGKVKEITLTACEPD